VAAIATGLTGASRIPARSGLATGLWALRPLDLGRIEAWRPATGTGPCCSR